MIARQADVWDVTVEIDSPRFRVDFWSRPRREYAWNLDAWALDECDNVQEALEWVETHADGRLHALYAVLAPPVVAHLTYVRLSGADPNGVPPAIQDVL